MMGRFLQEIWELWCWAMFCPSLKSYVNTWSPQENGDINFPNFFRFSLYWLFCWQLFFLISFLSLPLVILLSQSASIVAWLWLPVTLTIAYGVAVFYLPPIGINVPWLIGGLYWLKADQLIEDLQTTLNEVIQFLPPIHQLFFGIGSGSLLLGIVSAIFYQLHKMGRSMSARSTFFIGGTLIGLFGGWIGTQSLFFTLSTGIVSGVLLYSLRNQLNEDKDDVVRVICIIESGVVSATTIVAAIIVAVVASAGVTSIVAYIVTVIATVGVAFEVAVIFGGLVLYVTMDRTASVVTYIFGGLVALGTTVVVSFVVSIVVSVGVAVVVASISTLSLLPFLAITAGLAFSLSYYQKGLWGLWISGVLIELGTENLGFQVCWVLPVACAFYYRLLPEYLLFVPVPITPNLNFLSNVPYQNLSSQHLERWIKRLPPYTSELLWLPIPGHASLLAKVFQSNSNLGLRTLQTMQASPLPGLSLTAKRALPDIIAGQLLQIEDIPSLQTLLPEAADQQSENLLKILLPTYYEIQINENRLQKLSESDLEEIFPRLQDIAQTVDAALQGNNYALRERGLERSLNQLQSLKATLPSLGLKSNEIKRWQPVINRWKNILELELQEQQKLSQGELLNPFQYGNPLKRSQLDLFKGRQNFADNIVRLLLDRNRPTIILHGPRRCGKTSFLNNLPRLLPSDWLPVFVDIQSSAATADEISFLRSLARAIYRDSRTQGLQLSPVPERNAFLDAPYDTFETWLETVLDQLGERQLLLNLDEFEKIGTAINQGKLSLDLFDELRSLIQHWDQLGFIFSGVQTLDEIGPNWSSYFISVVPVEMLYLEPEEARDLLTNPDPEFALTYESGLVDTILDLTQCHPNLLQLIGAALVTEANERHTQTATADMLEAAILRAFTLGTSYFTNVWTEFTGDPAKPEEVRAGQIVLKALADSSQPMATDIATKAALRRMVRYHVLNKIDGQYEFDIPLIKRWVKERAILEELT